MTKRREFSREPTLRTARIVYLIAIGKRLTTTEVADLTGLSYEGARVMMDIISSSHHVPITIVKGKWQLNKVALSEP